MKPIVNSEEMKDCDQHTIQHFGVPSCVLMERAALSVVANMPKKLSHGSSVLIVCGNGNNGADGLAIARLLYQQGCQVTVAQIPDHGNRSPENKLQGDILLAYGIPVCEDIRLCMKAQSAYDCVVDALFGIGLSRPPKDVYAAWITAMNSLSGYKVAVDMPSGVSSDTADVYEAAFCADLTVTFAYQKIGQVLYPGCELCGKTIVAQIGVTQESWMGRKPSGFQLEYSDLKLLPKRPKRSNKGTFGKVLAIAGSNGMAGAAVFCAQAAYHTGCGLVKIATPIENREILQAALPEAVLLFYPDQTSKDSAFVQKQWLDAIQWADAIVIGPGLGTDPRACQIVRLVLDHAKVPVVIDADGLNILAGHLQWTELTKAKLVLTPHIGEMARLFNKTIPDIKREMVPSARKLAQQLHAVCVLKDAVTVTACADGRVYFNPSGCNAMAKGGSGDVLAGMIAALLAQKYSDLPIGQTAALGVYLHGLAGEAAARKKSDYSVLARDIAAAIGEVLSKR